MAAADSGAADEPVRYVRSSSVKFKKVGEATALYVKEHRALHVLNPTAELILRRLERPASLPELISWLDRRTEADAATIERDLAEALPGFLRRRVIERC